MMNSLSHCVYFVANFRRFVWFCGQKAIWKSMGYLIQSVSIIWIIWHPGGVAGSRNITLVLKAFMKHCTVVHKALCMYTVHREVVCEHEYSHEYSNVHSWLSSIQNHISLENLKDYFYPIEIMFTFITLICFELFLHFYIYFMFSFLLVKVLQ